MADFVPNTSEDQAAMLASIGAPSLDSLFAGLPLPVEAQLDLPPAASEIELRRELAGMAERNLDLDRVPCFLGAGSYNHYVPAMVNSILSRGEFYTSYTPYQAEISQGTLQAIYEFQTLVCQLTGMDVANASMYDGATALAEAALMAVNITGRQRIVVGRSLHPDWRAVIASFTQGQGIEVIAAGDITQGFLDGKTLREALDGAAGLLVQQPNFLGCIEDLAALASQAHEAGALLVAVVDPIALGLLETPAAAGADIVVADGQSLGNGQSFGGPSVGLFACRTQHMRRMPGRIVGATTDQDGKRGFVLTLQTREQHIRRERATSNICTNEALNALAATVYLSALGPVGLRRVAELCLQKAHYAAELITAIPGFGLRFQGPYFKEFAVRCPRTPSQINAELLQRGIIGGFELGKYYPDLADSMLFCVTELSSRDDIERLALALSD